MVGRDDPGHLGRVRGIRFCHALDRRFNDEGERTNATS